jgi:hypothetical protein
MAESMEWKSHFSVFQTFSDKLTAESQELKTRLEKERREACVICLNSATCAFNQC